MDQSLYRSRTDRVLFGVAGGMGEYFNVDSIIIRILFVILALWGGVGFLIYLIAALVIPEEPVGKEVDEMAAGEKPVRGRKKTVVEEERPVAEDVRGRNRDRDEDYDYDYDYDRNRERGLGRRGGEWRGEKILGIVILVIGLLFLAEEFIPGFRFGQLWPLILIGIGLLILMGSFRRNS